MEETQWAEAISATLILHAEDAWNGEHSTKELPRRPFFSVLRISLAPNAVSSWHTHPTQLVGYILSGALTLQTDRDDERWFRAGEAIVETVGTVHRARADQHGAELVVFAMSEQGAPLTEATELLC